MLQRLSHFSSMGPVWADMSDTEAHAAIVRSAEFHGTTEDSIRDRLAAGQTIECSTTDWESTADHIRDASQDAIIDAHRSAMDVARAKRNANRPRCAVCGKPAEMSASMGAACAAHYDELSN